MKMKKLNLEKDIEIVVTREDKEDAADDEEEAAEPEYLGEKLEKFL